jgi:hypothetical protein
MQTEMTIDLEGPIENLRSLKGDLESFFWDHPGVSSGERDERFQIAFWIRQLTERAAALEALLLHKGASRVVVPGLPPAERDALESAASVLQQWIPDGASFASVRRMMVAVLGAADRLGLTAAAGAAPDEPTPLF